MSEEYDYRLDGPNADLLQEIPETKIFVANDGVSDAEAERIFKQEKVEAFKGFFRRPKDVEIEIKSIKKSFEPYVIIGGEYEIHYLSEQKYGIDLIDNTVSVFILGEEIIVPEKTEEDTETEVEIKGKKKSGFFDNLFSRDKKAAPKPKPEIELVGIEHVHIKKEITEAKNYTGTSINPDSLPSVELREVSNQFLQTEANMVPSEHYDIEKVTTDIIMEYTEKPETVQRVLSERLTITDKKIVFYPVYWAEMVHKEKDVKSVRLDAISRKVEVQKGNRYAPPPASGGRAPEETKTSSGDCPGCGQNIEEDDKFCENCGLKLN